MTDADKSSSSSSGEVVELNVGGIVYATSRLTLSHDPDSLLAKWFGAGGRSADSQADDEPPPPPPPPARDSHGRYFIDRDGTLFRFVLDLRHSQRCPWVGLTHGLGWVGSSI